MAWQHEEWFYPSIPFQRSRSPVEITARWHDTMGLVWCLKPSMKKSIFWLKFVVNGNLKEEFEYCSSQHKKTHRGGDMVQWRPKLLFSHPRIPWVGLTDDSLVHLMQRWRVERAKLLATRDSKGLPGNSRADGSRKSNFITKRNGMNLKKKTTHFGPIFFMRQRWSEATTRMKQTKN